LCVWASSNARTLAASSGAAASNSTQLGIGGRRGQPATAL
jgi:hypothetical protein